MHVDLATVAVGDEHVLQHLIGDAGECCIDRLANAISAQQQVEPCEQCQRGNRAGDCVPPGRNVFGNLDHLFFCSSARNASSVGSSSVSCRGSASNFARTAGTGASRPVCASTISLNFAGCAVATITQ